MARGWLWSFGVAVVAMAVAYDQIWSPTLGNLRSSERRRVAGTLAADAGGLGQWAGRRMAGPSCQNRAEEAWADVERSTEEYRHPALQEVHALFRRLGGGFPALAECLLAELGRVSPLGLQRDGFPLQRELTSDGHRFTLAVTEPSEPWATARGYTYKGYLSVDGSLGLVAFWTGSGASSRGYLVQGPALGRNAGYLLWDRMASPQTVKVWAAELAEGYLSLAVPRNQSERPDRALYGELVFEPSTSALALRSVAVEPQRGRLRASGRFGCFRVQASGRLGDALRLGRTYAALGELGHEADAAFNDGSELEWIEVSDSRSIDDGDDVLVGEDTGAFFARSCRDVSEAGHPGRLFGVSADVVDYFATPTDVFGE